MSIKVMEGTHVYVVYEWDGYNGDFFINNVYATRKKAQEEVRRKNKEFLSEEECFDKNYDVDFTLTNNDSRYYWYTEVNLVI